jgi:hypothetical protein
LPNEDQKLDSLCPGSRGSEKRSLRRPKLSTRKFSDWKKKKTNRYSAQYSMKYNAKLLRCVPAIIQRIQAIVKGMCILFPRERIGLAEKNKYCLYILYCTV